MKLYLLAAASLALAIPAYATTPGNNGGGQGGCGVGQQTNGCGTTVTSNPSATAAATAKADALGVGIGVGIGQGGDAKAASVASQGQDQAQQQGQQQTATARSDQTQIQGLNNDSTLTQSAVGSGNATDISVYEEATKRAAASAYAAPLAIGGGVCAYTPASLAIQFPAFGGSGSGAKIDQGCETRATADMFARMGMSYEACLIMVSQPAAARAGIKAEACTPKPPSIVEREKIIYRDVPTPPVATDKDGERG